MKLLRVDSSARRNSISRQLTDQFVETWRHENPKGEVIERNLASTHLPIITDEWVGAAYSDPSSHTPEQKAALAISNELVEELLAADAIVISSPMYNFTIPAQLKGWIDNIVRAGRTVLWSAQGPQGALTGKKVFVITSRGGSFRPGTPAEKFDFQEPYLRHVLAFMGITDVTFIHAENQKPGEQAEISKAAAVLQIQQAASAQAVSA
jgi:FMN-dependent NADH-azoreductase